MAYHSTILSLIAAFLPRLEIDVLTNRHHVGQKFRSFNR